MSGPTAREVVVHGQVQGVFFRDSCRTEARAAGVRGWVTNAPDGTVHAHFEGPPPPSTACVAWVAPRSPRTPTSTRVDVREVPAEGLGGFEVR